jgi:hypothetical protein
MASHKSCGDAHLWLGHSLQQPGVGGIQPHMRLVIQGGVLREDLLL